METDILTETTPVVRLLSGLVQIPSLSHQESEAADFVQQYAERRGLSATRRDDNVVITFGDGETTLLLNSHLDVVPPSVGHPYDPFTPTIADGRLFGRGSVDAKASVATMLQAVVELSAAGWRPSGRIIVALTACEETGAGSNGLEHTLPSLPRIDAAIVGEPTDLQPCTAQLGLLILKVVSRGRSSHAARPDHGDNAINRAARDISRLTDLRLEARQPNLSAPTVTITQIEGGTASNVVPDECSFTLDIRSTPAYSHDELIALISAVVESEVEIVSKRLIPVGTSDDERIVQSILRAVPGTKTFTSPTMSDWVFLSGVPAVKFGPGDSRLSHTAGESIAIDELNRAVESMKKIIQEYFD